LGESAALAVLDHNQGRFAMSLRSSVSGGLTVSARRRRLNHRKLALEPLEDRCMLSLYAVPPGGADLHPANLSPPDLTDQSNSAVLADADVSIEITSVPSYSTDGYLCGMVRGVDFGTHRVATYIQIEGGGWWTKPYFASPTVPINPGGSFSVDVVTGGTDAWATIFCTAVVPQGETPPIAQGSARVPAELDDMALATTYRERYGRKLQLGGYEWAVKDAPEPAPARTVSPAVPPASGWTRTACI